MGCPTCFRPDPHCKCPSRLDGMHERVLSSPSVEFKLALVKKGTNEERHAVVLRLQARALAIRTLGKAYRWAADILEDEASAIKEGTHRG